MIRTVKMLGFDSAMCAMTTRLDVWRRLATDVKPRQLNAVARGIPLEELPDAFASPWPVAHAADLS